MNAPASPGTRQQALAPGTCDQQALAPGSKPWHQVRVFLSSPPRPGASEGCPCRRKHTKENTGTHGWRTDVLMRRCQPSGTCAACPCTGPAKPGSRLRGPGSFVAPKVEKCVRGSWVERLRSGKIRRVLEISYQKYGQT